VERQRCEAHNRKTRDPQSFVMAWLCVVDGAHIARICCSGGGYVLWGGLKAYMQMLYRRHYLVPQCKRLLQLFMQFLRPYFCLLTHLINAYDPLVRLPQNTESCWTPPHCSALKVISSPADASPPSPLSPPSPSLYRGWRRQHSGLTFWSRGVKIMFRSMFRLSRLRNASSFASRCSARLQPPSAGRQVSAAHSCR
jgi:hypothetical protein